MKPFVLFVSTLCIVAMIIAGYGDPLLLSTSIMTAVLSPIMLRHMYNKRRANTLLF